MAAFLDQAFILTLSQVAPDPFLCLKAGLFVKFMVLHKLRRSKCFKLWVRYVAAMVFNRIILADVVIGYLGVLRSWCVLFTLLLKLLVCMNSLRPFYVVEATIFSVSILRSFAGSILTYLRREPHSQISFASRSNYFHL